MSKIAMLHASCYVLPVPPVCHASWTDADWINYIDAHGKWRPQDMS